MERLSLERWASPWLRHQHVNRYEWATQFARGRRVLDAACGAGYGSRILVRGGASSVTSLDLSPEAFEDVRGAGRPPHPHPNANGVHLGRADVTRLPLRDHSHDTYLCFETIEHVADDAPLLSEARRILDAGGVFICSTPNRPLTSPGLTLSDRPDNPYHFREYAIDEFEERLRGVFSKVTLFGQTWFPSAHRQRLARAATYSPRLALRMHQARKIAGILWESPARHEPRRLDEMHYPKWIPEVVIAVCS